MSTEIYEDSQAAEKLDSYRQVRPENCFSADTDLGQLILIFDCPEVRGLGPEDERYSFLPTTAVPVPLTSPLLLLDIVTQGGKSIKVAFSWETGVPEMMLTAKYIALFAAKRPKGLWVWLNKKRSITDRNIRKFARKGMLDVNLEAVRENLETVIKPLKQLIDLAISQDRKVGEK